MASRRAPVRLTLRTYQVGFGDCFLLTFHYPPRSTGRGGFERHILIDFGTTRLPPRRPKNAPAHIAEKLQGLSLPLSPAKYLRLVAEDIVAVTGGKLHVIVATHRHKDHIDGFRTSAAGTASGNLIAELSPELVIMPWTEDPDAATDASVPTQVLTDRQAFVRSLADMQSFAGNVMQLADRLLAARQREGLRATPFLNRLRFLGENNLANKSAVKNLLAMGVASRAAFVHAESDAGLKSVLPGIKTHVLGPPTLEQSEAIRRQRHTDAAEFWHFQAAALERIMTGRESAHDANGKTPPLYARWLIPKLDRLHLQQTMQIVRILDRAMNNTSVILLFEVGEQKFLFPGDAQIENWSFALFHPSESKRAKYRRLLSDVTLYKVGHHGSLNATPKTLWGLFEHRSADDHDGRLQTVTSTLRGVNGDPHEDSEVPRETLVTALTEHSDHYTTNTASAPFRHDQVFEL